MVFSEGIFTVPELESTSFTLTGIAVTEVWRIVFMIIVKAVFPHHSIITFHAQIYMLEPGCAPI